MNVINMKGMDVIDEAAELLKSLKFSDIRGASADGHHVSILIGTEKIENQNTMQVFVSCFTPGGRLVDWKKMALLLQPEEKGAKITAIGNINHQGFALFPELARGCYTISLRKRAQGSRKSVVEPIDAAHREVTSIESRYGAEGKEILRCAAKSRTKEDLEEDEYIPLPAPVTEEFYDGRLLGTIRQIPEGLRVAFETKDPEFENTRVAFALVQEKSGNVEVQGEVVLSPMPDEPGCWEGIWEQNIHLDHPCILVLIS